MRVSLVILEFEDVVGVRSMCVFANGGKERGKTLDYVREDEGIMKFSLGQKAKNSVALLDRGYINIDVAHVCAFTVI